MKRNKTVVQYIRFDVAQTKKAYRRIRWLNFRNRLKLWLTKGRQCKSCCLFCKWFDTCFNAYGVEFGWRDTID